MLVNTTHSLTGVNLFTPVPLGLLSTSEILAKYICVCIHIYMDTYIWLPKFTFYFQTGIQLTSLDDRLRGFTVDCL